MNIVLITNIYWHIINLEALDRQLVQDIKRFTIKGDQEGIEIATEARLAVQGDLSSCQQAYDTLRNKRKGGVE